MSPPDPSKNESNTASEPNTLKTSIDPSLSEPPVANPTLFERLYPWLIFLVPMILYIGIENLAMWVIGIYWPNNPEKHKDVYPAIYSIKLSVTLGAMVFAWMGYPKFKRISPLSLIVGVIGVVLWIALSWAQRESGFNVWSGLEKLGAREGFNPWESRLTNSQNALWNFIVIRMIGFAVIIPIVEEMFLRGFVMRFVIQEKWWDVPFGTITRAAVVAGTLIPMLIHPAEMLAAGVWFGLVHWLYFRTRNVWDCVVAHGVTNLLLGIYILVYKQWWLW